MFELKLTISGLCMVSIAGSKGGGSAAGAQAEFPKVKGHETQLSFRRLDLPDYDGTMKLLTDQKRQLRRSFGPDGTDLLAVILEKGSGGFLMPGETSVQPKQLDMKWVPTGKANIPISEGRMDWLMTLEDLGITPVEEPGIQFILPGGIIRSKNIYQSEGEPAIFEVDLGGDKGKDLRALADDIEVVTEVKSVGDDPQVRFTWKDDIGEFTIRLQPSQSQQLEICVANDDVLVPMLEDRTTKSLGVLGDLGLLAEAIGHRSGIRPPQLQASRLTGGSGCPQVVRFNGGGG